MSISREAVEAARSAIDRYACSVEIDARFMDLTGVEQTECAEAALTAALPHLLAAKDAEIAALTKCAVLLASIDCLIDEKDESKGRAFDRWADDRVIFDIGSKRFITAGDLRRARDALEMSGGATPTSGSK